MRNAKFVVSCLMIALVALLAGGAAVAQQATTDIWKLVPPNSLVVAAFDTRPDNASMRAIANAQDPQTAEIIAKQKAAMRKAVEDFATLFGVSLDFAKDIDPWRDQQWAFVLLPGEKNSKQPVILIASKDPAAANAALLKALEPWGRIGDITTEPDNDFPIVAFKTKDKSCEVYASAYGPVVALALSKSSLKQALKGGGFPAGSTADKAFNTLSGSVFYAYADASLLGAMDVKPDTVPIAGLAVGASAIDTGMKLRVIGYPSENGLALLKQMLAGQQAGSLLVNPGVPSNSLVAASLPNLAGPVAMAGAAGLSKAPIFAAALAASKLQISASLTAVFPKPAWVISGMAESAEVAGAKRSEIEASLRASKISVQPEFGGVSRIKLSDTVTMFMSQHDKHILVADDTHSLMNAADVIDGIKPSIVQSKTYQETMAGLDGSNLLTLYANLAPIQGLGFLVEGIGASQWAPIYDSLAKSLQNIQSVGIGAGFDGEVASATIFLRAKPGLGPTIAPAVAGTAVGAAILFPVFERAREEKRATDIMSNMKMLIQAALIYADSHGGKLPTSKDWPAQLSKYTKSPIEDLQHGGQTTIAFNKNMSGVSLKNIQNLSAKVLFFETCVDIPNDSGSRDDAMLLHDGQGVFGFVDGHVAKLSEVPGQAQWVPSVAKKALKKAPAKAPIRRRVH